MSDLAALETRARFTVLAPLITRSTMSARSTATRLLYTYFIPHEESFMVLGDTLLRGFAGVKFHEAVANSTISIHSGERRFTNDNLNDSL